MQLQPWDETQRRRARPEDATPPCHTRPECATPPQSPHHARPELRKTDSSCLEHHSRASYHALAYQPSHLRSTHNDSIVCGNNARKNQPMFVRERCTRRRSMAVYLAACGVLGVAHSALGTPGQHEQGGDRETATKTAPDRTARRGCSIESSGVPSGRMEISRVRQTCLCM